MEFAIVTPVGVDDCEGVRHLLDQTWWASGRSMPELTRLLRDSLKTFGLRDGAGDLVAFARAVGDGTAKALLLDVVVDSAYRNRGAGRAILSAALAAFQDVADVELYCRPELVSYYEEFGFAQPADTVFMRRRLERETSPDAPQRLD